MATKKTVKKSISDDCVSKSDFHKLEYRLSLDFNDISRNFDDIARDMSDVQTRVHKLEDNQVKIDDCKDDDSRYFLRNFALPIGRLALGGIIVLGFIGVTITIIRDAIISILGA